MLAELQLVSLRSLKVDSFIQAITDARNNRHQSAPPAIRREGEYLEKIRTEEFQEITDGTLPNIPVTYNNGW